MIARVAKISFNRMKLSLTLTSLLVTSPKGDSSTPNPNVVVDLRDKEKWTAFHMYTQ